MPPTFDSPKGLVARANEHIKDFDGKVKAFFESDPYARVVEKDADGVNDLHKLKLTKGFPIILENVAFDVVGNLRSALDQCGYVAAVADGKINPKSTHFPIADSDARLQTDVIGRGRCKDIPADIVALFRSFKPHKGGNDLIWALNRLANSNKHRLVVPIATAAGGWNIKRMHVGKVSGDGMQMMWPSWDATKNEMIFARIGPDIHVEYEANVTFLVAFGPVEGMEGKDAISLLRAMSREVARVVLATEVECRRLGLVA